jgi:hypothetical protein
MYAIMISAIISTRNHSDWICQRATLIVTPSNSQAPYLSDCHFASRSESVYLSVLFPVIAGQNPSTYHAGH